MSLFFDTNILVYAVTSDPKVEIARNSISQGGQISVQVLNELVNVLRKKSKFQWPEIEGILASFEILFPNPQPLTKVTHAIALDLAKFHAISIYDALIVASAIEARCSVLMSEDLQHGRKFGDLTIINPFV